MPKKKGSKSPKKDTSDLSVGTAEGTLGRLLQGDHVRNKKGDKVSTSRIGKENEVIGLYFSAHWCKPCQKFTPMLWERYDSWRNKNSKKVTIIFISFDKTEEEFNNYYLNEMGDWYAIPFNETERINKLKQQFNKTRTIPNLVFINNKGETMTHDGRSVVERDPNAVDFPWKDYVPPYQPPNIWMRVLFRLVLFVVIIVIYRLYYAGDPSTKTKGGRL